MSLSRRALLATLGAGALSGCSYIDREDLEPDPRTDGSESPGVESISGSVSGDFELPHTLEEVENYRPNAVIKVEEEADKLHVIANGQPVETLEQVSGKKEIGMPLDGFTTGENTVEVEAGDHRAELGTVSYQLETPHELRIRPSVKGSETDLPGEELDRAEKIVDNLDAHSPLPGEVHFYDMPVNVAELHETHWNNFEILSEETEIDGMEEGVCEDVVRGESKAAEVFREAIIDEDAYEEIKQNPVEVPYSNYNPTPSEKLGGSYQDIREAESGFEALDSALRLFINLDHGLAPEGEHWLSECKGRIIPHALNWAVNTQTDHDIHAWSGNLKPGSGKIGWAYIEDSDEFRQFEVMGESPAATFHNGEYKGQLDPLIENTSYIFNQEWYEGEPGEENIKVNPKVYRHPFTLHYDEGMINPREKHTNLIVEKQHFTDNLRRIASTGMESESYPRNGGSYSTCPLTNELARELSESLLNYNSNDVEFDDIRGLAYVLNELESDETDYAIELAEERTGEYGSGFRPYKLDTGEPLAVSLIGSDERDNWNDISKMIEENPHDAFE